MTFSIYDTLAFISYCLLIIGIGGWLSFKNRKAADAQSYFLADKSLPFWVIGCSIVAANISAEQFIGMSGSGYAIGLGIATYEWLAALILIVVAKFFLPVFIENQIYTMPEFLAKRYDNRIKNILAVFWLLLFVFVNLSSILYLGALALREIFNISLISGILGLTIFSATYTILGGLKTIAKIDLIQIVFLVFGGLLTTYFALNEMSGDDGISKGFMLLLKEVPDKFHLILKNDDPNFQYLPGIRAIFGGIWIAGIYYFGANQYIIQKALGAKNLKEAQKGMVFAGFIKLLTPLIVVIPGIVAFALNADIAKPDEAYPWLLNNFVPAGIKGLVFAALVAAIVSSLSAIINSSSTIFTMDIYKPYFNKNAGGKKLVFIGRISGIVFSVIAACTAPMLGNIEQVFQFIQKYTGFISPAITAVFILGIFSKKATANAALAGILLNIPLAIILEVLFPQMPFLDKMLVLFFLVSGFIILYSWLQKSMVDNSNTFNISRKLFITDKVFNISSLVIISILILLYTFFW